MCLGGATGISCGGVDRGREQRGPETPWYVPRRSGAAYGFWGDAGSEPALGTGLLGTWAAAGPTPWVS
jgi:hypothetical protein